ncbi:phosphatase PAP2 family protein [Edaphobacter bradus]|uniref:phosphatase PAP2 family protein n=1 Tax=Edaphobacter bradus TaxID=2259016 RepID=UPI0021E01FA2|nr:phosphatase PAP2 family protein [Edaphobacter bradus]
MRASEWMQTAFPALLALAAWTTSLTPRLLPRRNQWIVTALAAAAILTVALARHIATVLPADDASILRDWLTVALFLVPYWQTGQFFLGPNPKIQDRLLAFDWWLLPGIAAKSGTERTPIGFFLEMAYLSCYPLVPLGLLAVYAAGLRSQVAGFWLVVLVSTYLCYAVTPFVPAYPPRTLIDPAATTTPSDSANKGRVFNRWILKHGSIHAISFPSAHVASAFAIALFLLRYSPPFGIIFLAIAISISLGAIIGRYHYALDVLLGAATALTVFLASFRYT